MTSRKLPNFAGLMIAVMAVRGVIEHVLARAVDLVLGLVPAANLARPALALDMPLAFAGNPVAPALLNEIRHEAGFSRRKAARHI